MEPSPPSPTSSSSLSSPTENFKLIFFVPPESLAACKQAVFTAGAGVQGKYSECCFTNLGKGQFRPENGANPAVGNVGVLEEVEEVRCEILCGGRDVVIRAVEALKNAHPYEEVPYEVYKLEMI